MKKLLNPSTLIAALAVFALFLPELDSFASQFSIAPRLLDHVVVIDDDRLLNLYGKLTIAALSLLSLLGATLWLRNTRLKLMLGGTVALVAYGWLRLNMNGMPLGAAVRTIPLVGIYVMTLTVVVMCGFCKNERVPLGLGIGFLGSGLVRLAYAVYCYRRYGGIQIFENTPALAMDGGLLLQWAVLAGGSGVFAVKFYLKKDFWKAGIAFAFAMLFAAAVAASFRRTAMVLVLGNLGLAIVIYFWLKARLVSGLLWMGGISLAAGLGLFVVMASVFGFTTAYERVLSLTKSANSSNSFSDSNEAYLDDQKALVDVLNMTDFAGIGPGLPYGVSRVSDQFSTEGYIPLHIGTAEMWASLGVVGMAYHLLVLFLLPLACVLAYRKALPAVDNVLFALASSYVLLTAFWPFAPPFYFNNQTSIIFGMCFGYILSSSIWVKSAARSVRGQLATPERPLAAVPA
jgi:hypothetical protein